MPYSFTLPAAQTITSGTDVIPIAYPNGYVINGYTAGNFKIGVTYTITSVGNTNFTLIGASANTVGTIFIATGKGNIGETGAASAKEYILYATLDQIVSKSLSTGNYNVGIGTSSPAGARLRVDQPAGTYGAAYPMQSWAYANYQITNLQIDGSGNPVWNTDADSHWALPATMIWQYRGAEKMRITDVGDVGIGTSTPSNYTGYTTLGIGGSSSVTDGNLEILYTNGGIGLNLYTTKGATVADDYAIITTQDSAGAYLWEIGNYAGITYFLNYKNNPMTFSTNGIERIRITDVGDVGIGTSTPTATLDVNGTVRTLGYTVATLPTAGVAGRRAYVTNALTPSFGATVVGGGAVKIPVFDNGTNWIVG
ncbi:hypothetical protein UFOVP84_13 [uncultured Caudovirales phage]|uniref:Uncharacterized protein n=1 Tax=uncultured Caudovirales phage TaxID=2100421 RepID=A0A6J5L0B3_9CAUD|nr:hypothetical protein UFOVP84_13 [uncultured Caudovirales phage]